MHRAILNSDVDSCDRPPPELEERPERWTRSYMSLPPSYLVLERMYQEHPSS